MGIDTPTNDIRIGEVTAKWAESNHIYTVYNKITNSTNDLAKEQAFTEKLVEESLALYLTDNQTKGRGRGKNIWNQETPGGALISSWSYMVGESPQPTTSCLVGLAVYRACSTTWPFLPWNLKAPNDVYIGDKKVAGILLENIMQDDETRIIVGLGLNVFKSPENVSTATSIAQSLPPGVPLLGQDWMSFLDRLLFELTDAISHCEEELSSTDQWSLLTALNNHPLLAEKYKMIETDGSLVTESKRISWSEL